jgi:hypothetical protein
MRQNPLIVRTNCFEISDAIEAKSALVTKCLVSIKNSSLRHFSRIMQVKHQFCERNMSGPQNSAWKTRLVEGGFPDRSFDIEFWQEQGDEAIFAAAWELVELAEEVRNGRKPTLQRTATTLKRI